MADGSDTEILMKMVDSKGDALMAESTSKIDSKNDKLLADFTSGAFFSLNSFDFGLELDDGIVEGDSPPVGLSKTTGDGNSGHPQKVRKSSSAMFDKWKTADPAKLKHIVPFPVKMDAVRIDRYFERTSPVLFQACARSSTFQSASIVKRKVVGGSGLMGFLRFDFTDVLVTKVGWDDAEVINESLSFVFRRVKVRYRQQAHDGSLMPEASVDWRFKADLRTPERK